MTEIPTPMVPRETSPSRSRSLNGWRRLWLALTALAAIIAVILGFAHASGSAYSWEYRAAVSNEFENPACHEIAEGPFKELTEPEYGSGGESGCWHIYTHRRYQSDPDRPLTMELYDHDRFVETWQNIGILIAIYLVMVLAASVIVYGVGKTVAWIRVGFRES